MNTAIKQILATEYKSKAQVIGPKSVTVTAQDGEVFEIICQIGQYLSEDTRRFELKLLEAIFDKNYSEDKEMMFNNVWRDAMVYGISFMGMSTGDRQCERTRIGKRIKSIREERGIEARDLAKLAGIDASNLSRIENGKYSVGLDILSKIAAALGKKIDLVEI